jgi:excisionase family DNA binding protein
MHLRTPLPLSLAQPSVRSSLDFSICNVDLRLIRSNLHITAGSTVFRLGDLIGDWCILSQCLAGSRCNTYAGFDSFPYRTQMAIAVRHAAVQEQPTGNLNYGDCSLKHHSNVLSFPQLVGAAVVAELTGWTKKHIYDLAKRCQIPHYRIGGSIKFDLVKVKAWLDQHEIAA